MKDFFIGIIIGFFITVFFLLLCLLLDNGKDIRFSVPPGYKLVYNGYYYKYVDPSGNFSIDERYFKINIIQRAWNEYRMRQQASAEWKFIK